MKNKKILGLIGLAARARNICFGADSVEECIKNKQVYTVIVAADASDRTKEKFKKLCDNFGIPIIIDGRYRGIKQDDRQI